MSYAGDYDDGWYRAKAEDEVGRLRAEVERLRGVIARLLVEKAALAEQLIQMGSDPS